MIRLIVFRFDRNPLVCRARVRLLRELNPGVPVCGLYGGEFGYRRAAFRLTGGRFVGLDDLYCSTRAGRWNWKHGDLLLAAWYRDVGARLSFDVVHLIEWDLLLLDSLDRLYARVPDGALGLTALTPVSHVSEDWPWLRAGPPRREWDRLLAYVRAEWGYRGTPMACFGPGPCLPRGFLERYSAIDVPELCHEELRWPLFAQVLGFQLADTGFRSWHDAQADRFFNMTGRPIDASTIVAELEKPDGGRVFHPARTRQPVTLTKTR